MDGFGAGMLGEDEPGQDEMTGEATPVDGQELPLDGPGGRLRRAREEQGLTLDQVAAETRIPLRHLETLEAGAFEELPGRTYAVGFARNYARAVGLDEREMAEAVRAELGSRNYHAAPQSDGFEPGDPARVPSRRLAWFGLFAALLLIAGLFAFYRTAIAPGSGPGSILADEEAEMVAQAEGGQGEGSAGDSAASAAPAADAPVKFTATRDGVWVRFYDDAYADGGAPLLEKQLAIGESFTIPDTAQNPKIRTGWPAALDVSIGGQLVGPLSNEDEVLSDVDVTAPALAERLERVAQEAATDSAEPAGG